jgi:hypothetical protein
VCNRTRNEHFACVQQTAKLNFAAVALTTAVKLSHFYIYLLSQLQHIYLHISGVILQNLDWLQLKFNFVSGTATISIEFSSGLKFPPISNERAAREGVDKKDLQYRSIIYRVILNDCSRSRREN